MSTKTTLDGLEVGDPIWLLLSDRWIDVLQSEARSGDEANMRLYLDCVDRKRSGEDRLAGVVEHVNVPWDGSYGHANVMVPALGCRTEVDAIGVDFDDLARREP